MTEAPSFARRPVNALGREVFRMGLATNFGLSESGVRMALERGLNELPDQANRWSDAKGLPNLVDAR
jgi:hypothetical protein